MEKICHRRYFIGCYEYTFKEVSRETFLKCLKNITKQEYEMLINGKILWRGNVHFSIKDEYEFIEDKFDLMFNKICETFDDRFYIHRARKIIDGIRCGRINRENLCKEIEKFTKRTKSEHSLKVWNNLLIWFTNANW